MGTNYYLHTNACPHCGKGEERHIGKSSAGWHFSLHVYPEDGIHDLEDWKRLFKDSASVIYTEYGEKISAREMIKDITKRSFPAPRTWTAMDYERNHAEPGLNSLVRHKVDGDHCVKNGAGTWDCIVGDFS